MKSMRKSRHFLTTSVLALAAVLILQQAAAAATVLISVGEDPLGFAGNGGTGDTSLFDGSGQEVIAGQTWNNIGFDNDIALYDATGAAMSLTGSTFGGGAFSDSRADGSQPGGHDVQDTLLNSGETFGDGNNDDGEGARVVISGFIPNQTITGLTIYFGLDGVGGTNTYSVNGTSVGSQARDDSTPFVVGNAMADASGQLTVATSNDFAGVSFAYEQPTAIPTPAALPAGLTMLGLIGLRRRIH